MTLSSAPTTQNGIQEGVNREQLPQIDAEVRIIAIEWRAGRLDEQSARNEIAEIAARIPAYGRWVPAGDRGEEVIAETRLEMMRRIKPEANSMIANTRLDLVMVCGGTSFTGWYLNLQSYVGAQVARTNRKRIALHRPISISTMGPDAAVSERFAEDLWDPKLSVAASAIKDHVHRRGGMFETPVTAALLARLLDLPPRTYGPASDSADTGPANVARTRVLWRNGTPPLVAARWTEADIDWFLERDDRIVGVVLDGATAERQRRSIVPRSRKSIAAFVGYEVDDSVLAAYTKWVSMPDVDPDDFVRVLDAWAEEVDRYPEVVKADLDTAFDRFERSVAMRGSTEPAPTRHI